MDKDKLKVLQVLPALESGGVERGTLEMAKFLVDQGHQSIVISNGGRLVEQLRKQGSKHIQWPIGQKSLFTLGLVTRLRRLLLEQNIDVLHARSRLPAWIAYLAWKSIAPKRRPKFITTVHGPYSVSRYSAVMAKGERVIVVSEMIRDYVQSHYHVEPERMRLIYRGVDRKHFPYGYRPSPEWLSTWERDYPKLKGKYVITLPARVTRWKGQQDFIDLIALLTSQSIDVIGLIVGETKQGKKAYLHELQRLAEKKQVTDRVCFLGHRSDLRDIMSISNVVLSLSREPEAFGRTTIEALSLGIPVIGYAHGGVDEQLKPVLPEGRVDVGDIQQVADRVSTWVNQPPAVPKEHPFVLKNMLTQTLNTYFS